MTVWIRASTVGVTGAGADGGADGVTGAGADGGADGVTGAGADGVNR